MPQTPLPSGEPIRTREDEIRWFEPVGAPRELAQTAADAAIEAGPTPYSARGQGVSWRGICWVGFSNRPDVANPAWLEAPQSARPDPPAPAEPESPSPAEDRTTAIGQGGTIEGDAKKIRFGGAGTRWRRRVGAGVGRLFRLGGAVASVGVIGLFVYHDGARLGGLAGTIAPPSEPAGQAAAPAGPIAAADPPAAPDIPAAPDAAASVAMDAPAVRQAASIAPDASAGGRGTALETSDGPGVPSPPPSGIPEPVARHLDRAKAGDPVAQYNLAVVYARGDEVVQDYGSAATWFREAAANGNLAAQFNLGVVYERGLGVEPDMAEAIAWYRRAAERDHAAAEYNLAVAYATGRGVAPDPVAAAEWYRRAAGQGLVPAMVNFAILCERGEGVELSLPNAYAWYRAAARRGDGDAAKRAGELFQQLTGAAKAKAVLAAAAVVDALREPSAAPSEKSASKSGTGPGRTSRN